VLRGDAEVLDVSAKRRKLPPAGRNPRRRSASDADDDASTASRTADSEWVTNGLMRTYVRIAVGWINRDDG